METVNTRAQPLRHTFVPIRRTMIGTPAARAEVASAMAALVATLSEARASCTQPAAALHVRGLLKRARRELELVEEKMLMLDRRRQRSIFRRAGLLRARLDLLYGRLYCYHTERTFDDGGGRCPKDPQVSPG